ANIHSGWRSTVQNITAATLTAMLFDPAASSAFLGPTIRACCFEVGEEVAEQFDAQFVDRKLSPKPHVNVAAYTTAVLREHGIRNIIDTGLCTRCDGSIFHSYRREKHTGRNLAVVMT
ncbi:MAG TPA: polyphenol oxidase family protein, partial [Thermoanaerobaculia bacterium]